MASGGGLQPSLAPQCVLSCENGEEPVCLVMWGHREWVPCPCPPGSGWADGPTRSPELQVSPPPLV